MEIVTLSAAPHTALFKVCISALCPDFALDASRKIWTQQCIGGCGCHDDKKTGTAAAVLENWRAAFNAGAAAVYYIAFIEGGRRGCGRIRTSQNHAGAIPCLNIIHPATSRAPGMGAQKVRAASGLVATEHQRRGQ